MSVVPTAPALAPTDHTTESVAYDRLRSLAARFLNRERVDHTLQPTALVHEVYLRVAAQPSLRSLQCPHMFALAARVMRDVLVDHARRKRSIKRGGRIQRHPLDATCVAYEHRAIDLLGLDDALNKLGTADPELSQIVELRFFGGLTEEEIAKELGVSSRTVRRGWRAARVWLARELGPD